MRRRNSFYSHREATLWEYSSYTLVKKKRKNLPVDPYFTTTHGVLFAEDCLKILRKIKSETIDTVFADPPFNLGKDYQNGYNDARDRQEYLAWCKEWIKECCRVLKKGGAIFIYAIPELGIYFGSFLNELGMNFRHWIALTMKGTYRRGKKLYPAHYALLYYTKGKPKTFNIVRIPIPKCRHCGKELKDYGGHRKKLHPEGLNLTDFWDDTSPNRHPKYKVRPGVNELKLMIPERVILISTNPRDIVLDPFGGGGSTYQAAQKHDRFWIGTELYDYEHTKKRLIEEFPENAWKEPRFNWEVIFESN